MKWQTPDASIFKISVLKYLKKQKTQKITCAAAVITPVIFSLFIIIFRRTPDIHYLKIPPNTVIDYNECWHALMKKIIERREKMVREDMNFKSNVFVPKMAIGYAPNTTVGIRDLVDGALASLSRTPIATIGYTDCTEMRIRISLQNYIAGICFHGVDERHQTVPLKLNFSILMPSELRHYEESWIGDNWKAHKLFFSYYAGYIAVTNYTIISDYVREGFLSLQYALSMQYFKSLLKDVGQLPKIVLRPFSINNSIDELISVENEGGIMVFLIGLMFPVIVLTKEIVEERELTYHYAMHRKGNRTIIQFASWYFNGICLQLVTCAIFIMVLKIEWSPNEAVIRNCPLVIIFLLLFAYALSAAAFCILLSSVICTMRLVVVVVPIYWIVVPLPVVFGQTLESSLSDDLLQAATHLMCNVTIYRAFKRLLSMEFHRSKLTVNHYLLSSLIEQDPSILMLILTFFTQTILYLLLAIFLEYNLFPWPTKLIKCMPCRLLATKIRRTLRKRRKRKIIEMAENENTVDDNGSQPFSDLSTGTEKLTRTIDLFKEHAMKLLSLPKLMNPVWRISKIEMDPSTDSMSSTSESIDRVSGIEKKHKSELDKRLISWLSINEIRSTPSVKESVSKSNYKIYSKRLSDSDESIDPLLEHESSDNDDQDKGTVVIEFKNVWKKFSKIFVVRNFSLKVYKNEVLVLLGHNAAGKSTILNMASGLTTPSHGEIYVEGFDIKKYPSRAFEHMGVSMKNLKLYKEFTFSEQLIYISRLRGLSLDDSINDMNYFLKSFRVKHLADVLTSTLTFGQMRLLQVLCAFAGRKRIIILDRPLEGVDVVMRQNLYDFVTHERLKRTILVSTNFPNVATGLGHRIAILVNGNIYACGKEHSLLRMTRDVYRLTCYMGAHCNFQILFNFFTKNIPDMQLESKVGDTAVFRIDQARIEAFNRIIQMLNVNMNDLHLDSFKISTSNLKQVVLKAISHDYIKNSGLFSNPLPKLANRIRQIEETKRYTKMTRFFADASKVLRHIRLVLKKRLLIDIRQRTLAITQIIAPSAFCICCLAMPHFEYQRYALPSVDMNIENLANTITLVSQLGTTQPMHAASSYYLNHITKNYQIVDLPEDIEIFDHITSYMDKNLVLTDLKFAIAAIFTDHQVDALYNNYIRNSAPISLNMIMNALAVAFVNPEATIDVKLELLPYSTMHTSYMSWDFDSSDWAVSTLLCLSSCFVWTMPLLDFGLSRDMAYNRLELISGMRFGTLSIAYFLYGFLLIAVSLLPLNAIIVLFERVVNFDPYSNVIFIYIFLVTGACVMSINILSSYWITELHIGYILSTGVHVLGIVIRLCSIQAHSDKQNVWSILPFYSMLHNLIMLFSHSDLLYICDDVDTYQTSVLLEQCLLTPNCCKKRDLSEFLWGLSWITLATTGIIWAYIYIRFGMNFHKVRSPTSREDIKKDTDPDSFQNTVFFGDKNEADNTWIREKIRVHTVEYPLVKTKPLHIESLAVFFRAHAVLNHINLLVERFQIMAVVGLNGSGKSVLIKTILGAKPPSAGTINSFGNQSYKYSELDNYKLIGWCAQDVMLKEALTVVEYIQTVLTVRGLSKAGALEETMHLLRIFDLYSSRYLLLPNCSRGVLKRVSLAISLIGYAGLILMDDPFAYLDVSSQLEMCSLIQSQCSHGQTVLFTSCDTTYCELANRTGMLHRTNMCVIGDRQELQLGNFRRYIEVHARIRVSSIPIENDATTTLRISDFASFRDMGENSTYFQFCSIIEHFFPHAIVKTVTTSTACFWLSKSVYTMSGVLQLLHQYKNIFYPFKISTPYLKSLFLEVVEQPNRKFVIIEDEDI